MATSALNRSLDESNNGENSRIEEVETLRDLKKTDYFDKV